MKVYIMQKLIIQEDYWSGTKCVENEVPWMVPGSIYKLDELCLPEDIVLEVGTGGSTLFFAKRCKLVVAIETNYDWHSVVAKEIKNKNIDKIIYFYCNEQNAIEKLVSEFEYNFSVISVDTIFGYNRSKFLNIAINKNSALRVIVLDNYSDWVLFPEHYNLSIEQWKEKLNGDWNGEDYKDNWVGSGTRILWKK
jgi:hypothetical protein